MFTKLYAILERLEGLHGIMGSIDDPEGALRKAFNESRYEIWEAYKISKPLIEEAYRSELDSRFAEETEKYRQLLLKLKESVLVEGKTNIDMTIEIAAWTEVINSLSDLLAKAISQQLVQIKSRVG
jgi:hypothetical protein